MEKKAVVPKVVQVAHFDSHQKFRDNLKTPCRKVTTYEIELYTGNGGVSVINGKEYNIKKGDILISKPLQIRNSVLHFRCYYIYLIAESGYYKNILDEIPDFMASSDTKKYLKLFGEIIEIFNSPYDGSDILLNSRVIELLFCIYRDSLIFKRQRLLPMKIDSTVVVGAIKFIEENYSENISLNTIAKSVNLSPIYFHKVFTALTAKTPHSFLIDKRIAVAKNILITTDLQQSIVATKCGFSSSSYFANVFKERVGVSPREYRNKMNLKEEL